MHVKQQALPLTEKAKRLSYLVRKYFYFVVGVILSGGVDVGVRLDGSVGVGNDLKMDCRSVSVVLIEMLTQPSVELNCIPPSRVFCFRSGFHALDHTDKAAQSIFSVYR